MTATRDSKHTRTPVRLNAVWVTITWEFLFHGSEAQEVECNHYYVFDPTDSARGGSERSCAAITVQSHSTNICRELCTRTDLPERSEPRM